ncbi:MULTISPECIES: hypothetical protein [Cryobacterium]|uniref:hypothetical protein n=1 Tax=Cryobacterium TaxID=69578 RepID=UPI000CD3D5BD|nr:MULTISPECIES: hypothetical protein [Cryobacterium]POH66077.1 hypothetical protein C3B60_09650 [Cryobacterium zongtaii]TFC46744.1 hypothetical protein E3O57_05790 [Cryobacterium sp. TMN-39-2]
MPLVHQRRFIVAVICGGLTLILLIAIGVYGLIQGREKTSHPHRPAVETSVPSVSPERADEPRPVLVTSDPEVFARSVARALFDWDTRHEGGPAEWAQVPLDVADAEEAPALASDVRGYLPTSEMWVRLSAYGTQQRLDVKSIAIPQSWSIARDQATAGQLPPGAAALTITGTSHRVGTWNTEVIRTERPVAFTIFVACQEGQPCVLLRLSQVDRPLK